MKPDYAPLAQGELVARYPLIRKDTGRLIAPLSAEDCALQSMPDASPVKWHLAHTTWFFETFVLGRFAERYTPFHPSYRYLFNSYYNAVGDQYPRAQRGLMSRPALDEVLRYRAHVDERMRALLDGRTLSDEALGLVELGLHHEQQHQELILTDVKHLFLLNPLEPAYGADGPHPAATAEALLQWRACEGGLIDIGHDGAGFAFDNEQPRHRALLAPFEIASRPATNGEYLAFIEDGGYRRPELWLSEGWAIVQAQRWEAPIYWRRADGAWREFTLAGAQPLDPGRSVAHLSHFEADAYAHWAGARLPTEFEWERAAEGGGEVWEWTSSSYGPYPGYRPASGAVGEYNGKFMSNQYVLRGASCATPQGHARRTYRNFFPSTARWQFSGVRLARDAA
ncbi:MAG: ergothioneine biosynthesis protein EgtB [Burkholderiales bacterium]